MLRLGFQNIGGFPRERNKIKEENIRIGISTYSFDIFGIVETNTYWRLVPKDLKLHNRLKHRWDSLHLSMAFNGSSAPRTSRQFGGVALLSMNKAAHRVIDKGLDASGLGRWCWTQYRGKASNTLRVIGPQGTSVCRRSPHVRRIPYKSGHFFSIF